MKKSEDCQKKLWDTIRQSNISIMIVLEGQETESGAENLLKIKMTENFPNLR